MKRLMAKELKIKFVETLKESDNFEYQEGNPFFIKIGKQPYYIFLKNLSSAYFKNSPDITRIQLPYSPHFSKISKENAPFIILGYDAIYDIFVCWNPKLIKERLNNKSNVSLYSRNSLQSSVKKKNFKTGYLSNGDKILLFHRNNLVTFFENFKIYFSETKSSQKEVQTKQSSEPDLTYEVEILNELTDNRLIKKIEPLLHSNKVLDAVEIVIQYYKGKYTKMTFKNWFNVVNQLYKK